MIVNHLKGKNTTQLTKSCQYHYKTSLLISISGFESCLFFFLSPDLRLSSRKY